MSSDDELIDITELMRKTPIIFQGKTYATRAVVDQIIYPNTNIPLIPDSPEERLTEIFTKKIREAIDIHTPHPAKQIIYSTYRLKTVEGGESFRIATTVDYQKKNKEIIIKMANEEYVHISKQ